MKKIKVLYYGISQNRGGIENYILRISRNLNKEAYDICYIYDHREASCMEKEFLQYGKFVKITPRSENFIKNKKEIYRLFQEYQFDVLHFNVNTLSYITPVYAALRYGCSVIVHSRSSDNTQRFLTRLLHFFHKRILPEKKVTCLAVSEKAGRWLFRRDLFQIVHNGIHIDDFRYDRHKREKIRQEFQIADEYLFCHIGVFLPVKNQKFVLDVFQRIYERYPAVKLLFIGEGPLLEDCRIYCRSLGLDHAVLFAGRRNDTGGIMSAADMLLFPSLYEGFPNVVLEAQTSGLQCVISDVITKEVVLFETAVQLPLSDGVHGWADTIMERMGQSVQNRSFYAERIAEKGFSDCEEIRRLDRIYRNISEYKT